MSCDRYWRAGILLVERGEPDSHRDSCADCRREHAAREELVRALGEVGSLGLAPPVWQTNLWKRIDRVERRRVWPAWAFGLCGAAAAAILLLLFARLTPARDLPELAVIADNESTRAIRGHDDSVWRTVKMGSKIQISARRDMEIRIYRQDELLQRCRVAEELLAGCKTDANVRFAFVKLDQPGEYRVILIDTATAEPMGSYDADIAAVVKAGGNYDLKIVSAE